MCRVCANKLCSAKPFACNWLRVPPPHHALALRLQGGGFHKLANLLASGKKPLARPSPPQGGWGILGPLALCDEVEMGFLMSSLLAGTVNPEAEGCPSSMPDFVEILYEL